MADELKIIDYVKGVEQTIGILGVDNNYINLSRYELSARRLCEYADVEFVKLYLKEIKETVTRTAFFSGRTRTFERIKQWDVSIHYLIHDRDGTKRMDKINAAFIEGRHRAR